MTYFWGDGMDIEKMFDEIKYVMIRLTPACYFLLKQLRVEYIDEPGKRVIFTENGPTEIETMACTDGTTLKLFRQWYELENITDKIAIILHELYHVILRHPIRAAEFIRQFGIGDPKNDMNIHYILNICMDSKVNYYLSKRINSSVLHIAPYFTEEELEKCSIEELFWKFIQKSSGIGCNKKGFCGLTITLSNIPSNIKLTAGQDVRDYTSGFGKGDGTDDSNKTKGKVLNEGSSRFKNCKTEEELREEIEKVIRDALLSAKMAGATLSGIEERILQELLQPKVNWRVLLRQALTDGVMKNVIETWVRPNRKVISMPGKRVISVPDVWCFVDVSGSIGQKEYEQFISEVAEITKHGGIVYVVPWDTDATVEKEYKIRRKSQIVNIKFRGGGGTTFAPVIRKYKNKIKSKDMVVILTDGYWFDTEEAVEELKPLADKTIICTTGQEIPLARAKNIKIDISS